MFASSMDQVIVYQCGSGQRPIDLWRILLIDLGIDGDAIGIWTVDRRFARDWNVRRLFRRGQRAKSEAIEVMRRALNDADAEIIELEDLRGQGSLYVGIGLTAIATILVRR